MKFLPEQRFAEEATPVVETKETKTEGIEDIVGSKKGMSDVLDNAPIIKQENFAKEQVVIPEENKTTPSKEETAVTPSADSKTEEVKTKDEPKVIQIGGIKKTEQEWLQADKDSQNKSTWQSKLKQINQIEAFTDNDPDKLKALALYATGRKELPENFMDEMTLPETITLTDSDGIEQDFATKDLPPELINSLKEQALSEMLPNTVKMAEENKELRERVEKFDKESQETGIVYVENFVNGNKELQIPLEEGQSFKDGLVDILRLPNHPEYQKAIRIKTIMQVSTEMNISMEEANKMLFGKINKETAINADISRNQSETAGHVKPSPEAPVVETSTETFIKSMGDSKAKAVDMLFKI